MAAKPLNCNVIVKGSWNRAIFTVNRVAKKLFALDESATLDIRVPVEGLAAPLMTYDDNRVSVSSTTLEVRTDKPNFAKLRECMDIAARALEWLPETPVLAAGYNIRYLLDGAEATKTCEIITSPLDNKLADSGQEIIEHKTIRAISYESGEIYIITEIDREKAVYVTFNFNKSSQNIKELTQWLKADSSSIELKAKAILRDVYGVQ